MQFRYRRFQQLIQMRLFQLRQHRRRHRHEIRYYRCRYNPHRRHYLVKGLQKEYFPRRQIVNKGQKAQFPHFHRHPNRPLCRYLERPIRHHHIHRQQT